MFIVKYSELVHMAEMLWIVCDYANNNLTLFLILLETNGLNNANPDSNAGPALM